jgi:capsular polysaccharide export protein
MKHQPAIRRCYLFLQGPHGLFFPRLGEALREAGHRVHRINLNGGDRATWPEGVSYRGGPRAWPGFVANFCARHMVSDLVLFGDCRPKHIAAIAAARRAGVRIHVFEEGYIRPDWVTLERDGVNGYSQLPRDPDTYVALARSLPPVPPHLPVHSKAGLRGWGAFFYFAQVTLHYWRFPLHRTHRPRDPLWEGLTFIRRFAMRDAEIAHADRVIARLADVPYMLFPLQLDSDYQIRVHSPFANLHEAIAQIIASFAHHAPPELRLVIKEHPLEGGLISWARVVAGVARRHGVSDRIDFIQQGDVTTLVQGAKGVVTVNSTTGTLALAEAIPVVVLGTAVYDIPGITHQDGLDSFWTKPQPPCPAIYDAFYRVLVDRCLIDGAFQSDEGINRLIGGAVRILTRADSDASVMRALA